MKKEKAIVASLLSLVSRNLTEKCNFWINWLQINLT